MAYLLLLSLLFATTPSPAAPTDPPPGSWPGVWGPARNGTAITARSPALPTGFKELWRRKTQGGYSEVAIHAGVAYTGEASNGTDFIVAMDAVGRIAATTARTTDRLRLRQWTALTWWRSDRTALSSPSTRRPGVSAGSTTS